MAVFVFGAPSSAEEYDCAYGSKDDIPISINQIYNPQEGQQEGYIELYVINGAINLSGWQLCYATSNNSYCINLAQGYGDVYLNQSLVSNDSNASISTGSFIIYDESLFLINQGQPTNSFGQSNGEAILIDNNNQAVHYVQYYNNKLKEQFSTGAQCTTTYPDSSANDDGICSTPDGTINTDDNQDDWERNCNDTKGTYNDEPPTPYSVWRMDECLWVGESDEVIDSIGNNHGTAKSNSSTLPTTSVDSVLNRAGEFKGEGYNADPNNTWYEADYFVEIDDSASLSPLSAWSLFNPYAQGKMTWTGWFKLDNTSAVHTILHKGSNDQEYRVYVEGSKLKFTIWNLWGSSKTTILDHALSADQYYFFAASANNESLLGGDVEVKLQIIDASSNVYSTDNTFSSYTYAFSKNGNLYFGATDWGWGKTNFLDGKLDEMKLYGDILTQSQINQIYTYSKYGKNYDGTDRIGDNCQDDPPTKDATFDAWNQEIGGVKKITTQLAGSNFSLTFTAYEDGTNTEQNFTGTVCARIKGINDWQRYYFNDENNIDLTFNSSSVIKDANIEIKWSDDNVACDAITAEPDNSTEATDNFSIRPQSLSLNSATDTLIAQQKYTLTTWASESGYDEIFTSNSLNVIKYNPDGFVNSSLNGTATHDGFTYNGTTSVDITNFSYSDVGDIALWIEDTTWTSVDQSTECYDNGCPNNQGTILQSGLYGCNICSNEENVSVIPDRFDVTINSFNSQPGSDFVYYDNNLTYQNAELNVTVTAVGADGITLQNYDENYYANDSNFTFDFTSSGESNLEIDYVLNGVLGSQTYASSMDFNLSKTSFNAGVADATFTFNFDRDSSVVKNPLKIEDINVSIEDNSYPSVNGSDNTSDDIVFYYARLNPKDLTTSKKEDSTFADIEVYSTQSIDGFNQTSLNWYKFTDDGVSEILQIKEDTVFDNNISFADGRVQIAIDRDDLSNDTALIHLDIPEYLWYSKEGNAYSFDNDCTTNPCIYYQYISSEGDSGVVSGRFKGSRVDKSDINASVPKGVKIFR
jgi:hypothetical protein